MLIALGVFVFVFAPLRTDDVGAAQTGARLEGVALALYPSRDADAVWRFQAERVSSNPLQGETRLTGLSDGGRWLQTRGADGQLTGEEVLDATLSAPDLTIDAQDNMLTRQARITLVRECADIDLSGSATVPVKIEQGVGFSAPLAQIRSPFLSGHAEKLRMSFNFDLEDMDNDRSATEINTSPKNICRDGRLVPNPNATAPSKES